jgi:hypothetical protein
MLDVDEYGVVSGTISADTIMLNAGCQAVADPAVGKVVYFFEGDVTPDDMDGADPEPLTTVDAVLNANMMDYDYRAILMPGNYTVAFTCEGEKDEDGSDDILDFISPVADGPITVNGGTPVDDVDF